MATIATLMAFACSAGSASAAITMVNPGFESGTIAGWTGPGTAVTSYSGYLPRYGSHFGLIGANANGGCSPNELRQSFTAAAGDTLSGSSFFKAGDYMPYNDTGDVRMVVTASGSTTVLFSSSIGAVGNYGGTPWVDWSFTFPSAGTYTLSARAANVGDCGGGDSVVGIDIPAFTDSDSDGIADPTDNCPTAANSGQANTDGDTEGDACDADDDNDSVLDGADNCAATPAGTGVASDGCPDPDSDGTSTSAGDNCPTVSNGDQVNTDGDGEGDACDADDDNDGVNDTGDDCAGTASGASVASDGCDDPDTDGVSTQAGDNCAGVSNADQANNDSDADGDACDADDDNDSVADSGDNCQFDANTDQANNDGDGQGDVCDADDDNDATADVADNCDKDANPAQENNDGDAQGDVCDANDDEDSLPDTADNCQYVANENQQDDDNDGIGDACDNAFDSSAGKSSGGGWLTQDGKKVNFSASAKSQTGTPLDGTCVVTAGTTKIKCLDVDGYYQSTTNDRVVFVGDATVNGSATRYRIEMEDRGEPGTSDRFTITTDSGYSAGGVIGGGNVQVHRK